MKNVNSVIGAGDCFAAVLALGCAHGLPVRDSVRAAFEAGTEYVKNRHNRPLTLYEIHRRLDPLNAKIVDLNTILWLRSVGPFAKCRWVMTNGVHDLLHAGHVATLRAAKDMGDLLVVGLNSDASVRKLKGPDRPILPEAERAVMLAAMEAVDFVVLFDDSPAEVARAVKPDVLVKGRDYEGKTVLGAEFAHEVAFVDLVQNRSTTKIIKKILKKSGEING